MASHDIRLMQEGNLEHVTKPTSLMTPAISSNGKSQWPDEMQRLAQFIPDTLPAWVLSDQFKDLPTELSYLVNELEDAKVDDTKADSKHVDLVLRVFPFAIWTCHQYRELRYTSRNFLFRDLLQRVIDASLPEFHVQELVDYATSRSPSPNQSVFPGLSYTSRQAPLIVLHDVHSFQNSFNSVPHFSELRKKSSSGDQSTRSKYLHVRIHEETNSDSCADSEDGNHLKIKAGSPWLDKAREAYLLHGQMIGEPPAVAILCAGPLDELKELMLGALQQRLAWNIRDPLIGLCWDQTGVYVTVILGCIGEELIDGGWLFHVSYPEAHKPLGRFDMTDPASVLKFILFISNIRHTVKQVARLFDQAAPAVVKSIEDLSISQWRADIACKSFKEESHTSDELVSRWRSSVVSSDIEVPPIQHNFNQEDTGIVDSEQPGYQWDPHFLRGGKDWQDSLIDELWLQNRRAFSTYLTDDERIFPSKKCYEMYTRYTRLYEPPTLNWNSLNGKSINPETSVFMEELHRTLEINAKSVLENDIWEHLVQELGQVAFYSERSERKKQCTTEHPSLQSDSRTDWDNLVYSLFRRASTINSSYRIRSEFEHSIRLPRDAVADILQQATVNEEKKNVITRYMWFLVAQSEIALDFYFHLLDHGIDSDSDNANDAIDRDTILWCRIGPFLDPYLNDRQTWRALRRDPVEINVDYLCIMTTEFLEQDPVQTKHCSSPRTGFSASPPSLPTGLISPSIHNPEVQKKCCEVELVLLYLEHRKPRIHWKWEIPSTSMNRAKMGLVAGITHLANLGIVEFPLFAIATDGCVGTVLCAWCGPITLDDGEIQSCIYMCDRDTVQYDLSTPIGAYNCATFLLMLAHKHAPELAARLSRVQRMGSELSDKDWKHLGWVRHDWTMKEQIGAFQKEGFLDVADGIYM